MEPAGLGAVAAVGARRATVKVLGPEVMREAAASTKEAAAATKEAAATSLAAVAVPILAWP